jgi:metal-responsive CopG/Arc/MetJ family transcriptional regulator
MVMRLSFSLDPELVEMIDKYASERVIKRDTAILELIEAGITHINEGGQIKIEQCRSFEDFNILRAQMNDLIGTVEELKKEVHLVHHTVERAKEEEAHTVPFQSKKWWKFW